MRIVLLGATGFVGQHLLAELSERGHECIVLCRNVGRCGNLRLIPGVELVQARTSTVETLTAAFSGADAVINLIGILNERGRNGLGFKAAHVRIVENLIEACRDSGIKRVIQVSALNAGKGESHYLASKGKAEELLKQASDLDTTIVQPSVIFGRGDSFFNRFAMILAWTPILPLACPDSRLQPVWVGDIVRAIAEILERPETRSRTFQFAGPRVYTLKELVTWTGQVSGRTCKIIGLPDALSRVQGLVMDFVPGKPFSTDNYKSLQLDSVCEHNDLPELGISPSSINALVPDYLCGGQHQKRLDEWRQRASRSP
jgi:NADH dehydrogenase